MDPPRVGTTDALLLAMALIWGVNYVVVKFATTLVAPLAYNWLRIALAAIVLGTLAVAARVPWPGRRQMLLLLTVGALGNGVYQIFFIEGVARTSVGNAALVLAAAPALIALFGRVWGVERIRQKGFIGVAISLVGIAFVVLGSARSGVEGPHLRGGLLILAGCICWSTYAVLLKPLGEGIDVLAVSSITMLGGVVAMLPFAVSSIAQTNWATLPAAAWFATVSSGVIGMVLAYLFWYRGVRVLGPTRTAMYSNLQPLVAIGAAWVALGEVPTAWQGIGGGLILAGLLLTRR
ncbi:MAG: EamA family transporter [Gemmatimonadaceae bacterium]